MTTDFMGFTEEELSKYRKILFPLVINKTITGYNYYPHRLDTQSNFSLRYLHSDLGETEFREEMPHKKELLNKFREHGLGMLSEKAKDQVVKRYAIYKEPANLVFAPEGCKFYDEKGNEIKFENLDIYDIVILECEQQEILFRIESISELKRAVYIFDRYANKHPLDVFGEVLLDKPKDFLEDPPIIKSWDTPVVIIQPVHIQNELLSCGVGKEVVAKNERSEITIFIDKNMNKLLSTFKNENVNLVTRTVLLNRRFLSWINGDLF